MLVAASEKGVCFVGLGESDGRLEAELARDYPAATLHRDEAGLGLWAEAIVRHLEGRGPHPDLPLDVQGTAFQWQVWHALRQIPPGQTRTYGEIAAGIEKPGAARAVARACASNPVAVVIPCHRVVGADGTLTGYRWGLERKRALLDNEAAELATC
ncbi:MAG: methylated-DNA--[protein]-cysteine S-methyltransferase [Chloroflexi bacterium]|nr:methylated-DNA--[protein]-cysteine S-methyltransferase [Chloroflexota bacterium]